MLISVVLGITRRKDDEIRAMFHSDVPCLRSFQRHNTGSSSHLGVLLPKPTGGHVHFVGLLCRRHRTMSGHDGFVPTHVTDLFNLPSVFHM